MCATSSTATDSRRAAPPASTAIIARSRATAVRVFPDCCVCNAIGLVDKLCLLAGWLGIGCRRKSAASITRVAPFILDTGTNNSARYLSDNGKAKPWIASTSVRLQVEQNQLVAIFGEIVLGSVRFECP